MSTIRRKDPTYRSWLKMKERCSNPNCDKWPYYGGRGIRVCDRWRSSFPQFVEDMGPRPTGKTLDRIDANGDYTPENCRWATQIEQVRNRRDTIKISVDGALIPLRDACARFDVPFAAVYWRMRQGASAESAFAAAHARRAPK